VFRINSHADYDDVKRKIKLIRGLNDEFGYTHSNFEIYGDKLRVGIMEDGVIVNMES
jgi:pyruvate kinase